jgi:hypothetical protein
LAVTKLQMPELVLRWLLIYGAPFDSNLF